MPRRVFAVCLAGLSLAEAQTLPDASKGNETFDEQCSSCHYADSFDNKTGPGLKLLFARPALDSNGKPVSDANVLAKINKGGKGMPAFQKSLSDQDKVNLIAYLKTL